MKPSPISLPFYGTRAARDLARELAASEGDIFIEGGQLTSLSTGEVAVPVPYIWILVGAGEEFRLYILSISSCSATGCYGGYEVVTKIEGTRSVSIVTCVADVAYEMQIWRRVGGGFGGLRQIGSVFLECQFDMEDWIEVRFLMDATIFDRDGVAVYTLPTAYGRFYPVTCDGVEDQISIDIDIELSDVANAWQSLVELGRLPDDGAMSFSGYTVATVAKSLALLQDLSNIPDSWTGDFCATCGPPPEDIGEGGSDPGDIPTGSA